MRASGLGSHPTHVAAFPVIRPNVSVRAARRRTSLTTAPRMLDRGDAVKPAGGQKVEFFLCRPDLVEKNSRRRPEARLPSVRMSPRTLLAVLSVVSLAVPSSTWAQGNTSSLGGVVIDDQHMALPGALVTVRDDARGAERAVQAGKDGAFELASLLPGPTAWTCRFRGLRSRLAMWSSR